jgi:RNA polymerase sigma factor (sigma-70 family)
MSESGTVFVVDDDPAIRRSLERLLRSAGYGTQTFDSARAFLASGRAQEPGCLVLDLRMPVVGGLELQHELDSAGCDIPIVFITGHGDVPAAVEAMRGGAVDMLTKPIDDAALFAAINRAMATGHARQASREEMVEMRQRFSRLTPREREVFALVITGLLNKQVAGKLGTSERTVKVHRARVMSKLRASSLAELVRIGQRLGLEVGGASGARLSAFPMVQ